MFWKVFDGLSYTTLITVKFLETTLFGEVAHDMGNGVEGFDLRRDWFSTMVTQRRSVIFLTDVYEGQLFDCRYR